MSPLLDDRVAIVTGGGRGLGRAHCLELAAHGAIVVVVDPGVGRDGSASTATPAAEVVAEIEAAGGIAVADATSVTDFDRVAELVGRTVDRYGRLDVVVNNAGILRDGMIFNLDEDAWNAVLATHLTGTFAMTRHACTHWRAAAKAGHPVSGRVINTTSGAGLFGGLGQANYAAAKAGIASLTLVAAQEMARYGVTVNAISPIARTRMTEGSGFSLPEVDPSADWDPYDAANAAPVVAWLASEDAHWLTGAVLRIEGDTLLRVDPWCVDPDSAYRIDTGRRLRAEDLAASLREAWAPEAVDAAS